MKYRAPRFLFRRYEVLRRLRPGQSFMEIGAADLTLTKELLQRFERGLAVDFTDDLPDSYAKLQRKLRDRLDVSNINVMTDAVPGNFDCIVACEVMEHIDDDQQFLRKIFQSLKPGGQVVISVPAKQAFWTIHDELVGHLRRYEKDSLTELATQTGFTDVDVVAYGYPWINWLSHLRVWLARRTMTDRSDWDQKQQTSMSNHRQIPSWLSQSPVPLFLNKFTIYPFALFSRVFNQADLSDGYVLTMIRPAGQE
jgi:SAM-dependent methyltransferase